MPAIQLTVAQRKEHRAEAHHLDPVVMIGNDGLTPAIKKETDAALNAHGLIKIRVLGDDRAKREEIYLALADELGAAPIQHIGKLLVLWRPKPAKAKAQADEDRMPGPREFKVLKYSKRGGQRPEVKTLRVLGNQRLTPGGQVKRTKGPSRNRSRRAVRPEGADCGPAPATFHKTTPAHSHCGRYIALPMPCHIFRLSRARMRGAMANSANSAISTPAKMKASAPCAQSIRGGSSP